MAGECEVIAAAGLWKPRFAVELDLSLELRWNPRQPALEVFRAVGQSLRLDVLDAPGSIILIEQSLKTLQDLWMIFGERPGTDLVIFLAAPVTREYRSPGMGQNPLQDPHRFEHHQRRGSVVGCPRGAIPRIEVR